MFWYFKDIMFVSQKQLNEAITTKHPSLEEDKDLHISAFCVNTPLHGHKLPPPQLMQVQLYFFFLLNFAHYFFSS